MKPTIETSRGFEVGKIIITLVIAAIGYSFLEQRREKHYEAKECVRYYRTEGKIKNECRQIIYRHAANSVRPKEN